MLRSNAFALLIAVAALACSTEPAPVDAGDELPTPDTGDTGDTGAADAAMDVGADVAIEPDIPPNEPPSADDDLLVAIEGEDTLLDVLANDDDPNDDPLTVELLEAPVHGTAEATAEGAIRYRPTAGWNGLDGLRYRVSDPDGLSAEASVEVMTYQASDAATAPRVLLPRLGLAPEQLAVVVNDSDPQSVAVAEHYLAARGIPAENLVHLDFEPPGTEMLPEDFAPLKEAADAAVGDDIQAWAISWTEPYTVGCMSVTSALSLGWDPAYCHTSGCGVTPAIDYYRSESRAPFSDHGFRPSMVLAGVETAEALALIDRGVASDQTTPEGTAYLVRTTDEARSVRWPAMLSAVSDWSAGEGLTVEYLDNSDGSGSNVITERHDVLFYLTGLANVPDIETNTYLPGAIADHLTSYGGQLMGSGQMSVLRWLEAGATGSYGTVVEPCNYFYKDTPPSYM